MTSAHHKFSEPEVMSANCLFCLAVKTSKGMIVVTWLLIAVMKKWRKAKQKCLTHSSPQQLVGDWFLERKYIISGCHFLYLVLLPLPCCLAQTQNAAKLQQLCLFSAANLFYLSDLWRSNHMMVMKMIQLQSSHILIHLIPVQRLRSLLIFKSTNQTNIDSEKLDKRPCPTKTTAKKNGSCHRVGFVG